MPVNETAWTTAHGVHSASWSTGTSASWPTAKVPTFSPNGGTSPSPPTNTVAAVMNGAVTLDPKVLEALEEFRKRMTRNVEPAVLCLVVLYGLLFCAGVIGNSVILFWVTKSKNFVQGRYRNYVLINLCAADLLVVLVCCPMAAYNSISRVWVLNEAMCKALAYLQGVSVASGTLALTALSLDRYLYTRHPSLFRRIRRHQLSACMILLVWLLSTSIVSPTLLIRTVQPVRMGTDQHLFCVESWRTDLGRRSFTAVTLVIQYALPCAVLVACHASVSWTLCRADQPASDISRNDIRQRAFRVKSRCSSSSFSMTRQDPPAPPNSYSKSSFPSDSISYRQSSEDPSSGPRTERGIQRSVRSRRRLAHVLMGMTVCFVTCWLPYNITSFCVDLLQSPWLASLLPFTLLLGHAHSAINPVVYWMLNRGARRKMYDVFKLRSSLIRKQAQLGQFKCLSLGASKDTPSTTDNQLGIFHPRFTPCRESDLRL